MAQPSVLAGTKLWIMVGDGATPEVFTQPCGLTTRGIAFTAQTNSTNIPDCDDPELPSWEAKDIVSIAAQVTGNGVLAKEAFDTWNNWFQLAEAKNCQITLDDPDLGYWSGSFVLTNFRVTGQRGQKVLVDITMDNNGAVPWTANP